MLKNTWNKDISKDLIMGLVYTYLKDFESRIETGELILTTKPDFDQKGTTMGEVNTKSLDIVSEDYHVR